MAKYSNNNIFPTFAFLALVMGIACSKSGDSIKENIMLLQSRKIHIPYTSLQKYCSNEDKITLIDNWAYKLVIYTDSASCSSCALKRLPDWLPLVDSLSSKIDILFIFSPTKDNLEKLKETLLLENITYPIYIDTCSAFIRANPHIPSNNLMHTFLLNEEDSVVLVGNPQSNPKIKELLFNILEESKQ